ncbi:hypothetical protein [Zoogloea dura]|jgi:hypothetical protein|uniref:hypothetical protein n=1 Tax=Zoogloea dura TaxID=2728840 RepID=UPI001981938E|nr:hypothetical protein [Zoogloea dura]
MTPVFIRIRLIAALLACAALASACDRIGIPDPTKIAAQTEAEGKAIGSACRHAGRAIEDCFTLNQAAPKAAVFAGWKEMNDYMVENKIAEVTPVLPPPPPPATAESKRKAKKASAEADKAAESEHGDAEATAKEDSETPAEPEPRKRRKIRE